MGVTAGFMAAAVTAVHETAGRRLGWSPTSRKTPPVRDPGNGHDRDCKTCVVRIGRTKRVRVGVGALCTRGAATWGSERADWDIAVERHCY